MDMSNNYDLLWVFFTMLTSLFGCSFVFLHKKTCLNVGGETTIQSTAMGDVLLEREFNYLLYGI